MPKDLIQFIGAMDADSPNENIGKGFVRAAYDVIWRGPVGNRRPEAAIGTTLVPNALLPNTGTHLTIGVHYDAVYKRVFYFNYNSAGKHGIYIFNTLAQPVATFQVLLQVGTNTVGDPLGFTPDGWISSIDILYGDAPLGPILYYVDSLGRPTQININRYLAGTYPAVQRSYIDVIKPPPIMAPQVTYENDFNVQANGLINSLWKFAYAHFCDNNEKTVISTGSKVALPTIPFDPTQNTPVSQNARLALYLQTGDATVKSIRIYGKETKDGATSDWMILSDIKKSDFGIPDNGIYKYLFFNTGSYITEEAAFAVEGFDEVPLKANAGVLLDGTTPAYAGILEGYNFFNPVLNVTAANQTIPRYQINGTLFFAATNGEFTGNQPHIQLFLTGCGDNDGSGNPIDLLYPPGIMTVRAKSDNTDISFSFTNVILSGIPAILTALQGAATAAGWTFVSSDTNSLTLYYPTGNVVLQSSFINGLDNFTRPYPFPQLAFYPQAAYQLGAQYFDGGGRTNGTISNLQGQITTPAYPGSGTQTPEITLDLSGYKPPPWAKYWRPVRTDQLTFGLRLDWISDSAYSGTGQLVNTMYAYFGISNIFSYNQSINATEGVISYGVTSFKAGDRIRVLGRYAANGSFTALNLDYAILSVVANPVIGGVPKIGTYIQINYPTADISANFKFDGSSDFQNYKILIYNYKAQNTSAQNTFWEVGETFGIGNPGQPDVYHMGNVADNIVKITDGDIFFRQRTVPIQNEYEINTGSFDMMTPGSTLWVNPGGNNVPIVDNGIWSIVGDVNKGAGLAGSDPPHFTDTGWTIFNKSTTVSFNVRFRGTIPVVDAVDPNGQFALFIKLIAPGNVVTTQPLVPLQTSLQPGVANSFQFDGTITMPPNTKIWLVATAVNEMFIGGFVLSLDVIRNIPIFVFDASYSDIYNLKTNSDNRPSIIDATAQQTFYGTLFRYAEPYQPGTNINSTNRFFDVNSDEFDASHGQVRRMIQWQRRLRVGQERKWGEIGVYSKFIKNNNGSTQLIVNDQIIEQNNIQYFDGDFGLGNQTEVGVNGYQLWFFDPVRGAFCRMSLDGIKQISEEFLVQTFAGSLTPAYLLPYAYPFGGNSRVLIVYNFTKDRYAETIFSFQAGTLGSSTIPGQSIAFIEKTNAFSSYYNYAPDAFVCAENQMILFSQGQLYLQNDTGAARTYFGTPIVPQLDLIFNDQEVIKKTFQALSYQSGNNKKWAAPNVGDIQTSFINPQTGLQQISNLVGADFEIAEGQVNAAFLRDVNSGLNAGLAVNDGDYLKGYWLRCLLTAPDNGPNFLMAPFIRWDASMMTP